MAEYALTFESQRYGKIIAVRLADSSWRISRNAGIVGHLHGSHPTTEKLEKMIDEKE